MANDQWFDNTEKLSIGQIVGIEGQYRTDSLICAIEDAVLVKDEDENAEISEGELTVLAVEAMEREVKTGASPIFFRTTPGDFPHTFPPRCSELAQRRPRPSWRKPSMLLA